MRQRLGLDSDKSTQVMIRSLRNVDREKNAKDQLERQSNNANSDGRKKQEACEYNLAMKRQMAGARALK